ncbi:macrophage mannose receptor 1-like [Haliotis asinina]|uniref:macrophage mannose receptor 1-like n=1 Tax=Haliotis asinina TaxID=109174 RepID=UPI0035320DEF
MIPHMSVRLALYFSTCIAICLTSCYQEGHLLYNQRIVRSSFYVTPTAGMNSCVANCQMHGICRSFTYHTSSHVCYLNYVTSNSSSTIMNSGDGFVSSDISTWNECLTGPCSGVSCGVRDRCTVHRTGVAACSPVFINGGNPYILVLQKVKWEEARHSCISSYGGDLAIVDSTEKINFLTDLIKATGDFHDVKFTIGATDIQEEDTWIWVDGSQVKFTYWAQGQPKSVPDQHCLVWKFGNGWRDRSCAEENFYICERSL